MSNTPTAVGALNLGTQPTILVVDDEIVLRVLLAAELRLAGYTVIEAADGEEALNILRSPLRVDAVVTDLAMPRLDGAALVRVLQSEFPYLKVVMVSGKAADPDVHRYLHGYFLKPVAANRIIEHLRMMVAPASASVSAVPTDE